MSILLSGCSDTSASDDTPKAISAQAVAAQYGYSVETAADMPTYAIVPGYDDPKDMYARMLLLKQCMKDVVQYTVLPPIPESPTTVLSPRTGERRLTVAIATDWGYHIPPSPDLVSATPPPPTMTQDQVLAEETACGAKTRKLLGSPPSRFLNDIKAAGWNAAEKKSEPISAATSAWKACMAPGGVIDLPPTPLEMPPPSVVATGEATKDNPPTPREVEVALLDAQCRESSGYTKTVFSVRANAELEAIGKDIESFEATRAKYEDYMLSIEKVIQEHG